MLNLVILFLVGATLGVFFDGFHTHSATTAYPKEWIFKMSWWVPLLFGFSSVVIATSHVYFDKILKRPMRIQSWFAVILGLLAFGSLYFSSAFLAAAAPLKILTLGLGALFIWLIFDHSWQGVILAISTAVIGCGVESTLSYYQQFYYLKPDFFRIPYWLPFLYVGASVSVGNLGRKLMK